MNNYIRILLMVVFFSSCSHLDKKKYDSISSLKETCFNQKYLNMNYIGMTKKQIIYIFDMPIISDSFNDVYHYYVYRKKGNNIFEKEMLNLYFKKDKVFNYDINK